MVVLLQLGRYSVDKNAVGVLQTRKQHFTYRLNSTGGCLFVAFAIRHHRVTFIQDKLIEKSLLIELKKKKLVVIGVIEQLSLERHYKNLHRTNLINLKYFIRCILLLLGLVPLVVICISTYLVKSPTKY